MPFAPSATHHNNKRAVLLVAMGIRLDHRERQPRPACRGLFVEHFWRVGCANSNRRLGAAAGAVEAVLWMTTDRFIAAHRAQLVDMLEDNIRMRRWMFDPKTRLDAIRQVADFTKAPIETYADWMFTHDDYYYDPHALVDVARLQKNIEDMSQAGAPFQPTSTFSAMSICRSPGKRRRGLATEANSVRTAARTRRARTADV